MTKYYFIYFEYSLAISFFFIINLVIQQLILYWYGTECTYTRKHQKNNLHPVLGFLSVYNIIGHIFRNIKPFVKYDTVIESYLSPLSFKLLEGNVAQQYFDYCCTSVDCTIIMPYCMQSQRNKNKTVKQKKTEH